MSSPLAPADRASAQKRIQRPLTPVPANGFQSLFQQRRGLWLATAGFPAVTETESAPGIDEDPEGRSDWFTFQRTYPGNLIPPDARLRAWEAQPEFQLNSVVVPEAAQMWHAIGPSPTVSDWYFAWGLTSGRVNSIAVSPANSRLVIIGSSTGGIWRSTDGGSSFVPVSDDQVDLAVGSLAFSNSNPSVVYAGMGDTKLGYLGSGVLKSTDEGRTWARVSNNSLPSPGTIAKLEIDPANSNRLFVAQYSKVSVDKITSSGVFRSTDGGFNWARTLAGAARDVVIDPGNSRTVYAGLSRIDKDADPLFGLYRSTDDGTTWSSLFNAQYELNKRRDIRVAISPANPLAVYAYFGGVVGDHAEAHLRASTDGGGTWADRSLAGIDIAQLGYNTYLTADPRDALTVYLGSRDVYRSTDGGSSWSNLTRNFYDSGAGFEYAPGGSNTHPDQHALAFSPTDPGVFYLGNDGGVSKTTDGGATFQSLNATLTLTQFIGITMHPTNPAISYGGTQDNGTQQRSANSASWHEIFSGDGGHCVINPLDPSIVFTTYVRGYVFRFSNDGQTFDGQIGFNDTFGEPFDGPRIAFYPPFVGNGVDASLYFGTWRLFISTDLGNSWFAPAGFLDLTKGITDTGRDVLSAIAVAGANTSIIYTGSAQGRAMASTNGGRSWNDITRGLPDRSITSITVDPANAAVAYLTVSGFNAGHIFRTTDTGSTWTDISGSLPDVPANTLLIDPGNANTIYLGTDIGVFRSTTGGAAWRSFNRGMPPVVVHGFSADKSGVIQVATYGRGAYELAASARPSITSVRFDGKKQLTIDGTGFGESPSVIINSQDRSLRIATSSDTSIRLTAKMKKLGLRPGDNSIQVVTADSVSSNAFTITL
ncbi:MAG: IPT/TIG domain-containing protein [Acidobacteriota bacterium]